MQFGRDAQGRINAIEQDLDLLSNRLRAVRVVDANLITGRVSFEAYTQQ